MDSTVVACCIDLHWQCHRRQTRWNNLFLSQIFLCGFCHLINIFSLSFYRLFEGGVNCIQVHSGQEPVAACKEFNEPAENAGEEGERWSRVWDKTSEPLRVSLLSPRTERCLRLSPRAPSRPFAVLRLQPAGIERGRKVDPRFQQSISEEVSHNSGLGF